MFWERFYQLCEDLETKPNPVGKQLGISSGVITKWKSGSIPNGETLSKIANYFDCSVDYLLGRSDTLETHRISTGNINGSYNANMNINSSKPIELDEMSIEVLKLFKTLSFNEKIDVYNYIKSKTIDSI